MEIGEIYYRRHADDIRITFDQNKIKEKLITSYMNNVHKYLELKKNRTIKQQHNLLGPVHP